MYAHGELAATLINPTDGLASRKKSLIAQAAKQAVHYQPFDDSHLRTIFDPRTYLAYNRDADYFWAPLIGLCTGARLAEIVTLRLDAIEEAHGNWFLNIVQENAKNSNSVRTIPIHRRLIELGFGKYIRRMRDLGAKFLFPHRDLANATAQRDPSKNCSRQFGSYLTSLQITAPGLVFHSFRHTVVQALQDGGTPLSESMQIVGHLAQDWAVQTGRLSSEQAQSVHISTYMHAGASRMNVDDPRLRLKAHLERCIDPPLHWDALAVAASIVLEHTVLTPDGFKSGWPQQKSAYTQVQLQKLAEIAAI